ncbi:hypothetical protein QFZ81_003953 [Paenibacillus sp. V4I9]|uniref:hypothetical protein n=1 Tax=Paenibacillus sp. V4I9 TaxID=3042308 RepID=UPI0027803181|nr:hypothetical protein [Paenibacillus sp. V4I9]MDQ0888865.1 hypothetical protein [Paenibacillus sp. V4I9]
MKIKFVALLLLFTIFIALTGCYNNSKEKTPRELTAQSVSELITIENVESLQVVGGLPGAKGSPLFQKNDAKGKDIITKIIGWLSSAKPVNDQTETQYGKHGYPMVIEINKNDGRTTYIELAYNCVSKTNPDGSGTKTCTAAEGEVFIYNELIKTRVNSPRLYEWLNEGWIKEE